MCWAEGEGPRSGGSFSARERGSSIQASPDPCFAPGREEVKLRPPHGWEVPLRVFRFPPRVEDISKCFYMCIYGLPPLPPTSYIVARRPSPVARRIPLCLLTLLYLLYLPYFTYPNCKCQIDPVKRTRRAGSGRPGWIRILSWGIDYAYLLLTYLLLTLLTGTKSEY